MLKALAVSSLAWIAEHIRTGEGRAQRASWLRLGLVQSGGSSLCRGLLGWTS